MMETTANGMTNFIGALSNVALALLLSPFLCAIIDKVSALLVGRRGAPFLQHYRDLGHLLRKGTVYSVHSSWFVRVGPVINLSCVIVALFIVPYAGMPGLFSFSGDFVVLIALLAAGRFMMILSALDSAAMAAGVGAGRAACYGAMSEPVFFLAMSAAACASGRLTIKDMYWVPQNGIALAALVLVALSLFVLLQLEGYRYPFDDVRASSELTTINRAMTTDFGGTDLAFIDFASMLKIWLMSALIVNVVIPFNMESTGYRILYAFLAQVVIVMFIGVIEAITPRLRFMRLPQLLAAAGIMAAIALFLILRANVS